MILISNYTDQCPTCRRPRTSASESFTGPYCSCPVPETMTTDTIKQPWFSCATVASPFIISVPKDDLRCPKCGHTTSSCTGTYVAVFVDPYVGKYCMKCYAKWISDNIPKLEAIK
jgi:hypothetical protein